MSFRSEVFRVMIASPGDVANERSRIRQVVYDWNDLNALDRKTVLLPVGWETHSSPEMGGRAQEIINEQVLKDCDLLVGVFWTRIGTATGKSKSGTVEEIEKHIEAGKPAMLYFSAMPVQLDSVDSEQYQKLTEFKKEVREKGLFEEYESLSEFDEKFRRQLAHKIINHPYFRLEGAETNYLPPAIPKIDLSEHAESLLIEAVQSHNGQVIKLQTLGGLHFEVNGKNLVDSGDPRSRALWESALRELCNKGYMTGRGHKGELFQLTHEGYEAAERLGSSS